MVSQPCPASSQPDVFDGRDSNPVFHCQFSTLPLRLRSDCAHLVFGEFTLTLCFASWLFAVVGSAMSMAVGMIAYMRIPSEMGWCDARSRAACMGNLRPVDRLCAMHSFADDAMDSRSNAALFAEVHDPVAIVIALKRPQQALTSGVGNSAFNKGSVCATRRNFPYASRLSHSVTIS